MNAKELTVLMVEPGKHPKVTKIKESWVARIESCSFAFDFFWGVRICWGWCRICGETADRRKKYC